MQDQIWLYYQRQIFRHSAQLKIKQEKAGNGYSIQNLPYSVSIHYDGTHEKKALLSLSALDIQATILTE